MRYDLLGTPVDVLTRHETLVMVETSIASRRRLQHVALNVAKLVSLRTSPELRADVENSDIVGIDGMGIVLALRLLGHRQVERVSGVDLMMEVLTLCAKHGWRPYFLGASPEVVHQAVGIAERMFPGLEFAGFEHGYFKSGDTQTVLQAIQRSAADCLFIGMPTPRKERLMSAWRDQLDVPFIMGVGGGLDVLAGKVNRAPVWMQRRGLEWAYRVYQEPGRMWWRYARTNARFSAMLLRLMIRRILNKGVPAQN